MKQIVPALIILLGVLVGVSASAQSGLASTFPKAGDKLDNVRLATLDGGREMLLAKAKVNVFVFFRPEHAYSKVALEHIARCQKELAGKSVRWVAVVSSRHKAAEVRKTVKSTGIDMPVLIDKDDKVYGTLGLKLHPMVGITDAQHKLVAYQPFRKLNFYDRVLARVRYQLDEISKEELDKVLSPPETKLSGPHAEAARRVKLGRLLLRSKKYKKALAAAKTAIKKAPDFAAGYTLHGQVCAAQGKCKKALKDFDKALELDPDDTLAAEGKAACQ
jgi:tetratricopeptide (TPR) repeat protein